MDAMIKNIECIMNPRSVAVVGATSRPGSVGLAVFRNILDARFKGTVYPVNPKANSVEGVKAYPSLTDIPDDVDLAVIIVPARFLSHTIAPSSTFQPSEIESFL